MKIGVCGTGRMGSAIAHQLMSVGHEVGVWNRDQAKTRPLVDAGAKTSSTPAVAAGALRCYEEAEIAGLSDADATTISSRWPNRKNHKTARQYFCSTTQVPNMIDSKNRYGRTAARIHDADGRARRPSSPTIDIHAHIVVPQAAAVAQPHVDLSRIPLAYFADGPTKEVNAQQEKDVREVMTTLDRRLKHLDQMGIDIQVVAPAPGQCYYTVDPKIAENAHRLANDGVAEYCSRKPDRFVGLGVVTLQEPELAVRELDYVMNTLKLKGVQILTNVDGQELSDPKFRPFFAKAEQLGAFIMMHPNGFTHGQRLTHYYFSNVLGNPLDTTLALHNLIFSGTLARFPELKLMAVHGGGYLPGYSGRIDHAWGARQDCHAELPLPPTTYLRQVYLDTIVFTYHQLAYLIDVFGPDRILMGTDYPFDMAEYNPIGHVAGVEGMDESMLAQIAGGNAARVLGLDL